MKVLFVLALAAAASARQVNYDSGSGSGGDYSSGGSDGYGTQQKCTPYFETQSRDQCESYTDRVCQTTQQESCTDVAFESCRGQITSKQVRKCFDVTELRCSLKEDVQTQTIQVPVTIQKCHKANERVCDTLYEASSTTKDNFQCIAVSSPQCSTVERTIHDRTCRTTTTFDCDKSYPEAYPAGGDSGYGASDEDSYGSGSSSGYEAASTTQGYGQQRVSCRRSQDTKCYKTPRTVSVQQCQTRQEKVCEKLQERVPFVEPRQQCHNEQKRVCELIERTQPKQVKRYVYTKQCQSVPRKVCENADQKALVPTCVPTTRKQCSYSPVEQCQDEPKQHCFKVEFKVKKQRCETVQTGYPAQEPSYGSDGASDY